jgi:hypothetical protein
VAEVAGHTATAPLMIVSITVPRAYLAPEAYNRAEVLIMEWTSRRCRLPLLAVAPVAPVAPVARGDPTRAPLFPVSKAQGSNSQFMV